MTNLQDTITAEEEEAWAELERRQNKEPTMEKISDGEIEAIARQHGTGGWQTLNDMIRFGCALLALSATKAKPSGNAGELTSILSAVEAALDAAGARIRQDDGHWLTLPQRIAALVAQAQPPVTPNVGAAAQARRIYLHVQNGGFATATDIARMVETIERLEAAQAQRPVRQPVTDERATFNQWFCRESGLPANADTTQYDEAFLPYRAWQARAALAQQAAEQYREDEEIALDLLDNLFCKWENGVCCYESPADQARFLGNAFRLDDETFRACVDLLGRRRPRAAAKGGEHG